MGNRGSLGHGGRFCTMKKSAGRKAARAGAELQESDGVALVKGVGAAALHVASGERSQCSSYVLFGWTTYLMQKSSIPELVRNGTTRLAGSMYVEEGRLRESSLYTGSFDQDDGGGEGGMTV